MENWKQELIEVRRQFMLKKFPSTESYGVPAPKPYSEKRTNDLTRAVMEWLKFNYCYVNRLNSQGQARKENIQMFGGGSRQIVRFTPGTTNKGTADLHALIKGKSISIEIKCAATKDRMRVEQWEEKKRIEAAGGIYIIVTDMTSFIAWYKHFIAENSLQECDATKK